MFRLAKHGTLFGLLLRFSPSFLFACAESNRATLAFKTTIKNDAHLTLIGIPSKVEANNSLIFLPLQTYEKRFAEFPFLFVSIIPWLKADNKLYTLLITYTRKSSEPAVRLSDPLVWTQQAGCVRVKHYNKYY